MALNFSGYPSVLGGYGGTAPGAPSPEQGGNTLGINSNYFDSISPGLFGYNTLDSNVPNLFSNQPSQGLFSQGPGSPAPYSFGSPSNNNGYSYGNFDTPAADNSTVWGGIDNPYTQSNSPTYEWGNWAPEVAAEPVVPDWYE